MFEGLAATARRRHVMTVATVEDTSDRSAHHPGAREHNLKDVSIDLPRDSLIVFTGLSGSGKSVAGVRHDLRRGPAPLRRVALGVRPPVPRADGQARRRLHRGALARGVDRPEVHVEEPALHGRHHHRGLRLPPAAVRPRRAPALPHLRRAHRAADPAADRRPGALPRGGPALPGARPGDPRPQGRVRRAVPLAADAGVLPRPGQRRDPPARASRRRSTSRRSTRSRSSSTGSPSRSRPSAGSPTRSRPPWAWPPGW